MAGRSVRGREQEELASANLAEVFRAQLIRRTSAGEQGLGNVDAHRPRGLEITRRDLQSFGPVAGVTFSRGHPLGPAAGEAARLHEQLQFKQQQGFPEIRRLIQNGDVDKAVERMNELGLPAGLRRSLLSPHMTPRTIREMYRYGTPEQTRRFERQLAPAMPTRAPAVDWQDWKPPK
jgi:hypothetical protein